jgi:hypothetical protein
MTYQNRESLEYTLAGITFSTSIISSGDMLSPTGESNILPILQLPLKMGSVGDGVKGLKLESGADLATYLVLLLGKPFKLLISLSLILSEPYPESQWRGSRPPSC